MTTSAPTRPVLRYHGGKWMLAPWIISHFPPHRIYVEPFGGAGSVLMRKDRSYAEVYNDLDGDVVNLFRVLRDPSGAAELERVLRLTPFSRREFFESYEPVSDIVERARRMVIRAYMSYSTTCRRRNRTGFRATPYRASGGSGVNDWANWPDIIPVVTERLQRVIIEERPAIEVIRAQDTPATLFYADPPYPLSTRTSIRTPSETDRAYAHDMSDDDHRHLADVLHQVCGMVILSGYPCELYDRELYPDWRRVERTALADGARERTEVLWFSPNVPAQQGQLFAFGDEEAL
jgi:DNA adenine methylase